MNKKLVLRGGLTVAALLVATGGAWLASLPPMPVDRPPPSPLASQEADAILAALRPPKRQRPLVAIIGVNAGTETTDYLMPYGILRRSGIADVMALATGPGPVILYPALKVAPDATTAAFDARYPEGADYVIVPAMHRDDDPAALRWIKAQAAKGAIVIGVCAGAMVVANTGLLDGKRATTHWYFLKQLRKEHPQVRYVPDRRFIVDRGVATTTGISASMPMALTLIEAIAGRDKALEVGRALGVGEWNAQHDSGAFKFTRPFALTAIGNRLSFWNHEKFGLKLTPGMDEVSLALVADAWSRTYRSRAITFAPSEEAREGQSGIRIIPDEVASSWPQGQLIPAIDRQRPAEALEEALQAISTRYGPRTGNFVAMQLEYPRPINTP